MFYIVGALEPVPQSYLMVIDNETHENLSLASELVVSWDYNPPSQSNPSLLRMVYYIYDMLDTVFGTNQVIDEYAPYSWKHSVLRLFSERLFYKDEIFIGHVRAFLSSIGDHSDLSDQEAVLSLGTFMFTSDNEENIEIKISEISSLSEDQVECLHTVISHIFPGRSEAKTKVEMINFILRSTLLAPVKRVKDLPQPLLTSITIASSDRVNKGGAVDSFLLDHFKV